MPRFARSLLLLLCAWSLPVPADPPHVVATVLPLHSLVSAVMRDVGSPVLLVPGNASPHDYALRPSEARALQRATLVFRIGPALETFLARPIANLAAGTRVVDLADAPGMLRLAARRHDDWSRAASGGPAAAAGAADEQGSGTARDASDPHGTAHGTAHGADDMHVWLSPANTAAMLSAIGHHLADIDPGNAERYAVNTRRALERLSALDARWRERLAPVRDKPFVVFHDAYQYLEHHYGLHSVGAVALSPERQPSAMHLRALLERMQRSGVGCLFREPQFSAALADMLVEGSGARTATLDPLGFGLEPGADAWFELMDANVESLANCLAGS